MKEYNASIKALVLSIVVFVLIAQYISNGITWNLNRSVGWGYDLENWYGIALIMLLLFSVIYSVVAIKRERINVPSVLSIIINLFLVVRVGHLLYQLAPVILMR